MSTRSGPILVSDFDGTMTRRDFYQLVAERLLPDGTSDFWADYRAGRLTHFEALRAYFLAARPGEPELIALTHAMGLDSDLRASLDALNAAGWSVVVASAGCRWYIDRLLGEAGVAHRLEIHANDGRIVDGRLVMELPLDSPVYSPTVGIDKPAVVRRAFERSDTVAFAGDGPPDVEPALLVRPGLRFATGHLAEELTRRGEPFRPFTAWSDVPRALLADGPRAAQ